jgi:hypothetical protein
LKRSRLRGEAVRSRRFPSAHRGWRPWRPKGSSAHPFTLTRRVRRMSRDDAPTRFPSPGSRCRPSRCESAFCPSRWTRCRPLSPRIAASMLASNLPDSTSSNSSVVDEWSGLSTSATTPARPCTGMPYSDSAALWVVVAPGWSYSATAQPSAPTRRRSCDLTFEHAAGRFRRRHRVERATCSCSMLRPRSARPFRNTRLCGARSRSSRGAAARAGSLASGQDRTRHKGNRWNRVDDP